MVVIRRFELIADQYYKEKKIFGFCHLYDGQEACAVGLGGALEHDDPITGGYRIHGTAIMRGLDTKGMFAELFGRQGASSKGKGGSMHYYNSKRFFYGGNGIVGD
jgi:pyruvate dehydrogenase E1 component alpha subunit